MAIPLHTYHCVFPIENRQGNGLVARWVEAWTSKPTGREFEARVFHTSGLGMAD